MAVSEGKKLKRGERHAGRDPWGGGKKKQGNPFLHSRGFSSGTEKEDIKWKKEKCKKKHATTCKK